MPSAARPPAMPTEVEAKFRADTAEPLVQLAAWRRLGDAVLGPPRTIEELDRYLDTDDRRLAARRWACRLRSRDGRISVSLKGPASVGSDGWHHRRPELEGPADETADPAAWPPSAARALVIELAGGRPLAEHMRLRQRRTERRVARRDGSPIGTLSLDRVAMEADGADLGRLHVVELELDVPDDEDDELGALARALASVPGLVAEPRSKLEHALEQLSLRR